MKVIVWVTETAWAACVDAARTWVPTDAEIVVLHVSDDDIAAVAHGAFAGLLGRSHPRRRDPGRKLAEMSEQAADDLLADAVDRLDRPATMMKRHGQIEREVASAAAGADLLICARDGDLHRVGPHSLGPRTRFVVDHAACPVLLIWPSAAPRSDLPPPPPHPPHAPGHPPEHPPPPPH